MKGFVSFLVSIGPLGVFLVAFIDGIGVPIPGGVDLLLVLLADKDPDAAFLLATVTLIGSLIGGMVLFYAARKGGEVYLVKYTMEGRGQTMRRWFLEYGLITVFIPALVPLIPLPLKVPEVCAGALGVKPLPFFLTLVAGRVPRYFGLAYLGAQLGEGSWPWVKAHAWHLGAFAVALFAALYLMVLLAHRRHKLPS